MGDASDFPSPSQPPPEGAPGALVAADVPRSGEDRAVQRILQVKGRRYSIRLEPVFWRVLEELSAADGIRLNALVRRIAEAEAADPSGNLTSRLRVYCARELRQRLMGTMLPATHRSLFNIAEVVPTPCLVVSARQEILAANEPFGAWFGTEARAVVGHPVARHFRFRSAPAFDEVWAEFGEGRVAPQPVRIISIVPGRVRAANATLQPIPLEAQTGFVSFVWLRT
ncbi:MAG: ribbon-helix-helix domain-containing protein [Alphaproteobacteria bacterium]